MTRQTATFSYFVIAFDFGRRGVEAIVDPEMTRSGAVALIREKHIGDGLPVAYAHFITMNDAPEDVAAELLAQAELEAFAETVFDHQAARFDHNRDLRKHEAV